MIAEKSKVKYTSVGRPYLRGLVGEVLSMKSDKSSAYVKFSDLSGKAVYTEWVGLGGLDELKTKYTDVLAQLRVRRGELGKEIDALNEKVDAAQTEWESLEDAIRSLTELESL